MPTTATTASKSNPAKIIVEKITAVRNGNLAAFATVIISDKIRISSLRVIDQPGKTPWVSMPQTEVPPKTSNDKRKLFPIVEILDQELKDRISAAVLAAYGATAKTPDARPARANIPPGGLLAVGAWRFTMFELRRKQNQQ